MSLRRGVLGFGAALGAVLAVTAVAAFACITPAVISLSQAHGRPLDVITVTGSSFSAPDNATTGVQIRWNGVEGPVLSEVRPDDAGTFKTTIKIPDGPPGWYVVTAVLRDGSGEHAPGTPGRALFEIRGAAAAAPAAEPAKTFTPASPAGSSFPLALVTALGLVGLVLFVGGFVAVARGRKEAKPVASRVRHD